MPTTKSDRQVNQSKATAPDGSCPDIKTNNTAKTFSSSRRDERAFVRTTIDLARIATRRVPEQTSEILLACSEIGRPLESMERNAVLCSRIYELISIRDNPVYMNNRTLHNHYIALGRYIDFLHSCLFFSKEKSMQL